MNGIEWKTKQKEEEGREPNQTENKRSAKKGKPLFKLSEYVLDYIL